MADRSSMRNIENLSTDAICRFAEAQRIARDPDQCAHAIMCDGDGVSRGRNATSKTSSTRVDLPV